MTFSTASRIGSSSADPIVALAVYGVVAVAALLLWAGASHPMQRTLRLLFLYLVYGTVETAVKRATHYAWYPYPIRFILFFLLVGYWLATRQRFTPRRLQPPFLVPFAAYLILAGVQILNPYLPNPIVGVFGWLSDFMFAVLYVLAFDLMRDERVVRRFLYWTAALGVLSAVACGLEQWIGPDQLMASYPSYVPLSIFLPGGGVTYRPASLSPYMEIFGIAAMVALLAKREPGSIWLIAGIALCVFASVLHAVRITWVTALLFVALFALFERWRGAAVTVLLAITVFVAVRVALGVNSDLSSQISSTQTPVETFSQTRLSGLEAIGYVVSAYPFGFGVGESSPGLRFVDASQVVRFGSHNYLTELAIQLSLVGPLLLLAFSTGVFFKGFRALGRVRRLPWRTDLSAALALFGSLVLSFLVGGGLGAFPSTEYFWLLAGILARMSTATVARQVASRRTAAFRLGIARTRFAAAGVRAVRPALPRMQAR